MTRMKQIDADFFSYFRQSAPAICGYRRDLRSIIPL
jgi:hypothetical protein